MSDDEPNFSALKAAGREKRTDEEQKQAVENAKKKVDADAYRRFADQKNVVKNLTGPWTGVGFYLVLYGTIPIAMMVTITSVMVFDANGVLIVAGSIALSLALVALTWWLGKNKKRDALEQEKAWIDNKPFAIRGYPDVFVYRSYPSFRMTLKFVDERPSKTDVLDALSTLPFEVKREDDKDGGYTFEVENSEGSKFDGQRRWVHAWIRQALDQHVMAIHREFPIDEVMIGEGKKELNFDWWVPLDPQAWWWSS